MATHSSTLAWKIPWMEEPSRLQSMGSRRVGHDWATSLSLVILRIGEGNGNPLQCSCLENPRDGEAWWAAVCGVAQSRTRLKQLSSSSSNYRIPEFSSWRQNWLRPIPITTGSESVVVLHGPLWSDPSFMSSHPACSPDTSHCPSSGAGCWTHHCLLSVAFLPSFFIFSYSSLKIKLEHQMLGKASPVPPAELVALPSEVCCPPALNSRNSGCCVAPGEESQSTQPFSPTFAQSSGSGPPGPAFFPTDDKCLYNKRMNVFIMLTTQLLF